MNSLPLAETIAKYSKRVYRHVPPDPRKIELQRIRRRKLKEKGLNKHGLPYTRGPYNV